MIIRQNPVFLMEGLQKAMTGRIRESLSSREVTVRELPLKSLLREVPSIRFSPGNRWVRDFCRRKSSQGLAFTKIHFSPKARILPDYFLSEENSRGRLAAGILSNLSDRLGLGSALYAVSYAGVEFIFLPPAMLLGAVQMIHRDRAIGIQFTTTPSSLNEVRDLLSRNLWPLRLSAEPWDLHEATGLDPYLGALHDLFHALVWSGYGKTVRKAAVLIHDALRDMPSEVFPPDKPREVIMDQVLSGPNMPSDHYRGLLGKAEMWRDQPEYTAEFGRKLRSHLKKDAASRLVWNAFRHARSVR